MFSKKDLWELEGSAPSDTLRLGYTKADWEGKSKALIAITMVSGWWRGAVLASVGPHILTVIEDVSSIMIDDIVIPDVPSETGLWVWEGRFHTSHVHTPDCNEYEAYLVGTWRKATDGEVLAFHNGLDPFAKRDTDA